ncbi:helix-turn-helix domain-containing protein (plasmid) [Phaeobacter inhibens]|uniref:helix-turn-helix domain-containing protein n=1 Tax=Phaeobacter inhibens TaxID=221822 RepID=UPI00220094EA|nr:helix-turn-helix domain-containing protein [Phaeobacter inhibens]
MGSVRQDWRHHALYVPGTHEKIGQRFFDYINHWRIQDAKNRLRSSDATILAIAYDVGFNSRSSFYTAFKRELGADPFAIPVKEDLTKMVVPILVFDHPADTKRTRLGLRVAIIIAGSLNARFGSAP